MWESTQHIRELQCDLNERREVIVELINPKSKEYVLLVDHSDKLNTELNVINSRIRDLKRDLEDPTDGLKKAVDTRQQEYTKTAEHIASLELVVSTLQTILKARTNIDFIDTALLSSEYDTAAELMLETRTAIEDLPYSIVNEIRDFDLLAVEVTARKSELTRCLQDSMQTFFNFECPQTVEVCRSIPAEYSRSKVQLEHVWFAYRQIQGLDGIMERLAHIVLNKLLSPLVTAANSLKTGATIKHETYQCDDREGWSWTVQISSHGTKKVGGMQDVETADHPVQKSGTTTNPNQLDELASALQSVLTFFQLRVFHPSQEATESFGRALWPNLTKCIVSVFGSMDIAAADTLKKFELTMKGLKIVPAKELYLSNIVDERALVSFNQRRQNVLTDARTNLLCSSLTSMTVRVSNSYIRRRETDKKYSKAESDIKTEQKLSAEEPMLDALMSVVDWTSSSELPVSEQEMELNIHSGGYGDDSFSKDPALRMNYTYMPRCSVSVATDRLVKVIQQLHIEASATLDLGHEEHGRNLFSFSKELAMLFMALRPTAHKNRLVQDPTFVALFYSDCLYLSNILAVSMYNRSSSSDSTPAVASDTHARRSSTKTPSLLASRFYFDLVVSLNALQRSLFTAFLKRERNFILRSLSSTATEMGNMSLDSNYSFVEMTFAASLQRIQTLAMAWLPILPIKTYLFSVAVLVDVYLCKFLENVFRLPELTMRNTTALSHAVEAAHSQIELIMNLHVDWYSSPAANHTARHPTNTPYSPTEVKMDDVYKDTFTKRNIAATADAFDALDAAESEMDWWKTPQADVANDDNSDDDDHIVYLSSNALLNSGVGSWEKYRLVVELIGGDYSAYVLRAETIRLVLSSAELKRLLLLSEEKLPHSVSESMKVIYSI
eukprot:Lankesteria_metandrocarpae@DN4853_c0_g1_i5.p1